MLKIILKYLRSIIPKLDLVAYLTAENLALRQQLLVSDGFIIYIDGAKPHE